MGDPGAPAALLNWGFPISGRALRKIAEDADIIPIAKDDTGKNPLSVGRRYRTATPKMRIALAERDRRCIWFGCNQPPERTEGHHEIAWAKGGNTEVARMSLLCKFHHGFIGKGWELTRMNDGQVFVHRSSEPGTSTHDPPPF